MPMLSVTVTRWKSIPDKDGGVIFKKYSLMGGIVEFAGQLCETLNRTTGRITVITDRDSCIAQAGAPPQGAGGQTDLLPAGAPDGGETRSHQYKAGEPPVPLCADEEKYCLSIAAPYFCRRGTCWEACCLWDSRTSWWAARWSTNWPSPFPPFWEGIWRVKAYRALPKVPDMLLQFCID